MMIGAGFLALPSVFYSGGLVASVLTLLVMGYIMMVSCVWEGRAVVQAGRVLKSAKVPEVTEAFNLFVGSSWRSSYLAVLSFSLITVNWTLAILFAHSVVSSIPSLLHSDVTCDEGSDHPICQKWYYLSIVLLACVTSPLSVMNIGEQAWIQNTLAFIRVTRMLIMCVTPMLPSSEASLRASFPVTLQDVDQVVGPPLLFGSWHGVFWVISAAVFGLFLNGSIPIIVDSLRDRGQYLKIVTTAYYICMLLYIWLAFVVSTRFGNRTMNPCNLNWAGYRLPMFDSCEAGSTCDSLSRLIEFIVVFCPAIDAASAFPFISIVLGNSLTELIFGMEENYGDASASAHEKIPLKHTPASDYSSEVDGRDAEPSPTAAPNLELPSSYRLKNRIIRFLMNLTPIILAVLITDFSFVIQVSGAISVLICFFFPAVLSVKSQEYIFLHLSAITINTSNFISWIDNKRGDLMWTLGALPPRPRPGSSDYLEAQAQSHAAGASVRRSVLSYLRLWILFENSEAHNPEDDIVEREDAKMAFIVLGFVITIIIAVFSA
jgi:amino acid permease